MLEYQISAISKKGGTAFALANQSKIAFDASANRDNVLPNPAELLLSSLSACILKNIERFSSILDFDYEEAKVEVKGIRNDNPPFMSEINYTIFIVSDMEENKLKLLHKNIQKFGTITNTLAKCSNLHGTIKRL